MGNKELFDYEQLLENYYHEEQVLQDVMHIFIDTAKQQINALTQLFQEESIDLEKARFLIHSIKGSSYNLNCKQLGDSAYEMLTLCHNQDVAELTKKMPSLLTIFDNTIQFMQSYIKE